ncbi:META domain-containing protein [Acetobacter indonesiensis]|uniref:META domain-containing protein n=1 Tax=Acetobacter indonesiensis TaxID=104101 RepID=UPI000A362D74|nr:META domain-containing protein [Acetobacter indonesiensis]
MHNFQRPSGRPAFHLSRFAFLGVTLSLSATLAGCAMTQEGRPVAASHAAGSVYQASGNEPFWHLTLAQNTLTLEQPGKAKLVRAVTHAQGLSGQRIYDAQDLKVIVEPKSCSDSMSGRTFAESVSVTAQGQTMQGCGGDAQGLSSLNDTRWVAIALNGQNLADGHRAPTDKDRTTDQPAHDSSGPMMAPTLDINATGKVSGSDGCNRYVGGLVFGTKGDVKPTKEGGLSTLMACPGVHDDMANKFKNLKQAVTHWHMDGTTLVLETDDKRTIRLRQVF